MRAFSPRLVGLVAAVLVTSVVFFAGPASAQQCVPEEVDAADFTVDGEVDVEAYLAAVAAANAACDDSADVLGAQETNTGSGSGLAVTGSDSAMVAILGAALLAVGAGATWAARRLRPSEG